MTLKTKLITSVSMFFLVVALLVVGVWAVSTAQVTMGGTISFNATNIYATITGTIEGATNAKAMTPLEYSAKTEPDATAKATWCQDLTFADATIPTIKWTITIENKSERALYVSLKDNITSLSNATKTLTFAGSTYTSGEKEVPAKTSKAFTMEIKVDDTNASATVDYDFDFILRDISTDAPSYVEFVYDETAMTATIQAGKIIDTTITEAYIPAKVTKDGKEYDVVIGAGFFNAGPFSQCTSLKTVIIGDGITSIGMQSFASCKSIEKIIIPDSVTSIKGQAFKSCTSLKSIRLPEGLTLVDSSLFSGCSSLVDVYIPNSVTSIGDSAFANCTSLANIKIPDGVTEIGQSAFYGCTALSNIEIPDSVIKVGLKAFENCPLTYTTYGNATYLGNKNNPYHALILSVDDNISSATIHENCKVIAGYAFSDCVNLTTVFIPESVKGIGEWAFGDCSSLYEVQMESAVPPVGVSSMFVNCHANFRVAVPQSAVDTYKAADYWKNYSIGFSVDV